MDKIIFCELNMDTACVELWLSDGSMIIIGSIPVENTSIFTLFFMCSQLPKNLGTRDFDIK